MNDSLSTPTIVVCDDAHSASVKAASLFADAVSSNPRIVLGLATGGTPVQMYLELIRLHRDEGLNFSAVTSFNLDEYIGLAPDHPHSYRTFMQQSLFDEINIQRENTHVPNGLADDPLLSAREYEAKMAAAGGVELQLLGIGNNGHIAFNEPGSAIDSRTRVVQLTKNTIESNARFFESIDEVPKTAITMGIGTILETKQIVMLATGEGKADAIQRAIAGEPDESNPASLLQNHINVTFVLDKPAAAKIAV